MDQCPDLVWHDTAKFLRTPLPLPKGTWIHPKSKQCHKHTKIKRRDEKLGGSHVYAENAMNRQLPWGSRQSPIQPRVNRGETRVKRDTASRRLWSRQAKITRLAPFLKHAGVNLSPPQRLSRSSPPHLPKPWGNSHVKRAVRGADLFGTSDKFSCPEQAYCRKVLSLL